MDVYSFRRVASSGRRFVRNLTNTIKGLVIADFDGDGKADIAGLVSNVWKMSKDGTDDWTTVPGLSSLSKAIAVGRFDDQGGSDVLTWNGELFELSSFFVSALKEESARNALANHQQGEGILFGR